MLLTQTSRVGGEMRRFRRVVRRWKYRQRGVTKVVSSVGKSKGRTTLTNNPLTYSLRERSKKMLNYLF